MEFLCWLECFFCLVGCWLFVAEDDEEEEEDEVPDPPSQMIENNGVAGRHNFGVDLHGFVYASVLILLAIFGVMANNNGRRRRSIDGIIIGGGESRYLPVVVTSLGEWKRTFKHI